MKIDQDPDISTMSEGNSTHLQLQPIIFLQVICLLETKRCILSRIFLLFLVCYDDLRRLRPLKMDLEWLKMVY